MYSRMQRFGLWLSSGYGAPADCSAIPRADLAPPIIRHPVFDGRRVLIPRQAVDERKASRSATWLLRSNHPTTGRPASFSSDRKRDSHATRDRRIVAPVTANSFRINGDETVHMSCF
jgi:hypothetical protein